MKSERTFKGLNIPLFDGWKLRSDKYNVILCQTANDKELDTWFYSDIPSAIEGFILKKIRQFDSTTIQELTQALKSLQKRLNELLEPLNLRVVPSNQVITKQEKLI